MPKLTELSIKSLRPPTKGQKVHWDELSGFGVRVSQGGTKTFVLVYGPERKRITIGRYPIITLAEAREAAKKRLAAITLGTHQPSAKITSEDAISAFLEHCDQHTSKRTRDDYARLLNRHFPKGKLSSQTRQTLLEKLAGLSATPGEQSHASTAFNVFLNWCVTKGHIQGNPLAGIRGVGRIKKRERVLTDEELKAIWQKSKDYEHPFGAIVQLLILTGQRKSEVANLRWSWIHGDTITIPAAYMKGRLEHAFPIGEMVKDVLRSIPRTNDDRLFKGRGDNIWNGWSKTKKDFDPLKNQWQLHDLRRTFRTIHGKIGTPPHIGERLVAHVSTHQTDVQRIYDRHSYLPEMTEATTAFENHLRSLLLDGRQPEGRHDVPPTKENSHGAVCEEERALSGS